MQCIIQSDAVEFALIEKKLTIAEAMKGSCIMQVEREIGENSILKLVGLLLLKTSNFFNIGKNMSEDQAIEAAGLLLEEFKYETMEDFVMMLKMIKTGAFGKMYDRFDGAIVLSCMREYVELKAKQREVNIIQKQYEEKKDTENVVISLPENTSEDGYNKFCDFVKELERRRANIDQKHYQDAKEREEKLIKNVAEELGLDPLTLTKDEAYRLLQEKLNINEE